MCDVKMNKRLFTKKFFAHDFLEKFYVVTNNFFFEKKFSKSSLFKKNCYSVISAFQTEIANNFADLSFFTLS
jgi:hypothetical protein